MWGEVFHLGLTSSCFLCDRLRLRPNIKKWILSLQEEWTGSPRRRHRRCLFFFFQRRSDPLCLSETCYDSVWCWRQIRPCLILFAEGSELQTCSVKTKSWNKGVVFPASPPDHCSNCPNFKSLIHNLLFLRLPFSARPSSVCLWAELGRAIYLAALTDSRLCTAGRTWDWWRRVVMD